MSREVVLWQLLAKLRRNKRRPDGFLTVNLNTEQRRMLISLVKEKVDEVETAARLRRIR